VRSHGTCTAQAFFSNVSACLEAHSLVVDLTSSSQQTLSLAICAPNPRALESAVKELNGIGMVNLMEDMSIISVIGHKMRNMVGVGAEIFTALAHAKINIYLISQGASEINISYVQRLPRQLADSTTNG
jgi:aspartate kinase